MSATARTRAGKAQESTSELAKTLLLLEDDSGAKQVVALQSDKRKLETQVQDLLRANAKLKEQVAKVGEKHPSVAHQLAALQSSIHASRAGAQQAEEEARALHNLLRGKDKELARLGKRADEAAALEARNGALENMIREAKAQAEDARADSKKNEALARAREADVEQRDRDVAAIKEALAAANAAHAQTAALLKAVTSRANDLETDLQMTRDELVRTGTVAARVAASEVKAGSKDEGTIAISQHISECNFLVSEASRMRDKVAALEKQLAVADELKVKYRTASERASLGGEGSQVTPHRRLTTGTPLVPGSSAKSRVPSASGKSAMQRRTTDTILKLDQLSMN